MLLGLAALVEGWRGEANMLELVKDPVSFLAVVGLVLALVVLVIAVRALLEIGGE